MNGASRFLLLTVVYVLYICIGAGVFVALEQPYELNLAEEVREQRHQFLTRHSQCLTPGELDSFVIQLENAWNFGVSYSRNVTEKSMWGFGGAFFFTTTLLTTIGYGHVSPLTWNGQLFCLFFALFGIPLTFFFLGTVTYVVSKPSRILLDYLAQKLDQSTPPLFIRLTHLMILFLCVLGLFFLVPAALFSSIEKNWNFFESFYFIFISLTTVGLGDFVPVTNSHDSVYESVRTLYFICVSIYLLLGLGMMLLLVDTVINIPAIQGLWEMSSMTTPSSSPSTSVNSSRSASPTPIARDTLLKSFRKKSEEERELTRAAAPIGTYDTIREKENSS